MADAELSAKISTTSDVPQAMDRAKSATVSFGKQVEDIQKKFSTGFKDIFLGFTAPMVIINSIISTITQAIEDQKRKAKEGFDLIAQGDTAFANSEEKRFAAYLKARKAREDEEASVKAGRIEVTNKFAETPEGGKLGVELAKKYNVAPEGMNAFFNNLKNIPEYQKMAMDWFLKSKEAQEFPTLNKDKNFKGPEGFSNVIGVGANPVLEAMNAQLEEQRKQTALLEKIASPEGGVPKDFTKDSK
jgi:hypothetical protein